MGRLFGQDAHGRVQGSCRRRGRARSFGYGVMYEENYCNRRRRFGYDGGCRGGGAGRRGAFAGKK